MTSLSAALAKNAEQNAKKPAGTADKGAAFDRSFGQIGISAVAAAARYHGTAKNPAYAPAPVNDELWSSHAA
jgi:hypothetical protein